jgi:hypothetical protein
MSFISPLDYFTSSQIGEKGTFEYTWSNNIQEQILQLTFQLTRTYDTNTIKNLSLKTDKILTEIISSYKTNIISRDDYLDYMSIMYRIIAYTRDIIYGKGEYKLAFMLLEVWHNHFPQLAQFALRHFVLPPEGYSQFHPYGSWKDIKYLFLYFNKSSPLIDYSIQLVLEQLNNDLNSSQPSLLSKWIPREKTKFGQLFSLIATNYFNEYINTSNDCLSKQRAISKSKMEFRKIISHLNKKLDTVQIKQCSAKWNEIEPHKLTSITMNKQKKALLNIDNKGQIRSFNKDRIYCADNFKEFCTKASNGELNINGKLVSLNHFTSQAIKLINNKKSNSYEADILNAQWLDNSQQNKPLGNFIPILDLSLEQDSFNAAIAIAIRIAEKSAKRILTFSSNPSWINLEQSNNFVDMVEKIITSSDYGLNANFSAALKLLIDAIIIQKLRHEDVENMVLAIISDMQVDEMREHLIEYIEKQYAEAGQKLWSKPFKLPHILFWNIRSTNGFPSLSTQPNCSMISGYNTAILNNFFQKPTNEFHNLTPWTIFLKNLNNDRYKFLDQYIRNNL